MLRRVLLSPLFAGSLAVVFVGLAVWFAGPLLPLGEPRLLDSVTARLIVIGAVAFVWLALAGIHAWRRRRRNEGMIAAIAAPDPTRAAIDAEGERLRARFAEALAALRRLRFRSRLGGQRYVYELPWYVFIGPPASGKTTALLNCGLEFPLRRGERVAIDGAAGTRDCDWLFTDQAVFIDTAGRYVTQDSDAAVDRSAWTTFLDLLRRHRPAEPLNGVIVAISLTDLAAGDPAVLDRHALAIRRGLLEIAERMGARVPVYVMLTKLDLLSGFNETFQGLDRAARERVWGVTFPLEGAADPRVKAEADLERLGEEFDLLLGRLGEAQFRRLQEEPDLGVRARVFGFCGQFASLRPVLLRFLRETFGPDRYSDPILLRGLYFTSATQEGQPIDRLIGAMSREFGLAPQATGVLAPQAGRAYFLRGLLSEVIFPEAGLVGRGRGGAIASAGRWAALAAAALLPVALGGGLWAVERGMAREAQALVAVLTAHEADQLALEPDSVADAALERALPLLDRLRAERDRLAAASPPLAALAGLGVADMGALRAQAGLAYAKALDDLFRSRLMFRLERVMDARLDEPAALYDALKTYLMLAGRGELDPAFVRAELARDWAGRYDPAVQRDLLASFGRHLDALLDAMADGRIRARSVNETQVAAARAKARDVPPAGRAFAILAAQDAVRRLPAWTLTDPRAGGRVAEQVFLRASGLDLATPIPGLYTREGFLRVFLPNADAAVAAALSESWVLAEGGAEVPSLEMVTAARRGIRALYYERYIALWQGLLDDLRIVPFRDAGHAADVLRTLAAGGSPLRGFLQDVARQTALTEAPAEALGPPVLLGLGPGGGAGALLSVAVAPGEGEAVARAFADLRGFVGSAQSSPLEGLLLQLGELRTRAADMAERRVGDLSEIAASPAARALRQTADSAPAAVRRMMAEMVETFNATVAGGLRTQLTEAWAASVLPACRQRLMGRYPFGGGDEVPLGDLAEVIGPQGAIDRFFTSQLAAFVDTGGDTWRWKGLGQSLGIPQDRLQFFQRAARLRDAFFPEAGPRPEVPIRAFAVAMHPEVQSARLDIGGQLAEFRAGERSVTALSWPGLVPENGAEAVLMVDTGARDISGAALPPAPARVGEIGTWGLFRLMDRSEFRIIGAGDRVQLGVSAGGRRVVLEMRMDRAVNPLALRGEMRSFQCPATL